MSQQINLLLPELRPRFDWLALPVVLAGALAGVALAAGLAFVATINARDLAARDAVLKSDLAAAQQQSQTLGKMLGERQGNVQLPQQIEMTKLELDQRRQVLDLLATGGFGAGRGFSGIFQGFSRQIVKGVWLVGFGAGGSDIEIRGRLTDPALLPAYVGKLNDEAAFAGRRFATLNMKGFAPAAGDAVPAAAPASASAPYTEFVLSTTPTLPAEPKK